MQQEPPFVAVRTTAENHKKPGISQAGLATKLAFFIAGFGLACWAPMVPYAKARLGASHAELGTVLLFLGLGSVLGMPAAGTLAGRLGSKAIIVAGSVGLLLALPMMAGASTGLALGAALFLFGLSLGAVDVAANIHGTEVQTRAGRPLMSSFHGLYSVGGLVGAAGMTAALSFGLGIVASAMIASAIIVTCIAVAISRLLATRAPVQSEGSFFVMPHGIVVLLGVMALLIFLVEGAVLDWGAVLLSEYRDVSIGNAGAGYVVFALTMTIARLVGDRFVLAVGNRATLLIGSALTLAGIALATWGSSFALILVGFGIAGFGAANIVPVLFSLAGTQKMMPAGYAIAATSTLGYLGVFLGPAVIGYAAGLIGLPAAFGALAALMVIVAGLSGIVVRYILGPTTRIERA
ncbi:MFS transporter [Oceanimonas sp. AH20CE76]|uniref:MFS transporter n=1 Tax=Oceanimonas sp. AH20CE76 TaxID=2977120 RepID=UPI0031FE75F4